MTIQEKLLKHDKRFDAIDMRFDEHDKRFDEHDKRFDAIDARIDNLTAACADEFAAVHEELREIKETMATKNDLFLMETRLTDMIKDVLAEFKNHDRRIVALERIVRP